MNKNKPYFFTGDIPASPAGPGAQRQILGHDDQLMMLKMDFETGAVGAIHEHLHTQATYILSGAFEFTIGTEKKVLKSGDGCFMPAHIAHGCICLEAGSLIDVFTPERKDFLT